MSITPLSKALVLALHTYQLEEFGGLAGLGDEGMLDSALVQPFASFGEIDLYPTLEEKAARYAFGIIKNHPFADANKRTGTAAMVAFLKANGCHFKPRHKDLEQIILGVASGEKSYDDLVAFVKQETAHS
ncbi:MAG: type II toxin-antitoxin system death-on-curing family toxin [Eggerthellaceae bacterium]|jgi:death-on-curing protein|nr:type II toxin-antitoxin system death-on-curing family toxin [Eggerthellaceae bacterium]MDR2721912.1 type II toxin-antitoxin system death-on-curing family toxin [Coriobacteriaceae bacterium]